jgi:ferredoxin
MSVTIIKEKCPQNHPCPAIKVCPADALSQEKFNAPEVDEDLCIDCGKCMEVCPMGAFQLE